MNNKLSKNIKLDYIYCFMKNFDLSSAIWVLYLAYKGIPLWQIGVLEGIFHLTGLICEVPTGAMADLFGRKKIIIIGRLCSALSSVLMLFGTEFWQFAVAFIISAWGYNLNSGSEEALVYDSVKLLGDENNYLKINSRLNVIIEISQAISTFVGGVLSEFSYSLCYLTAVIIAMSSFVFAFLFKEPSFNDKNKDTNDKISIFKHFKTCYEVLKDNKMARSIILYYPIVFAFYTVLFFYGQQYFSDFGLNKIEISLIMLLSGLFSCIGALSCENLLNIFKEKTVYFASILMCIGIIGMFQKNLGLSIIFFTISSFANSLLYPIQSSSLNKLIPSEQRATIISVDSMLFSVAMILLFPITGAVSEFIGLHNMFLILGILQLIFVIYGKIK